MAFDFSNWTETNGFRQMDLPVQRDVVYIFFFVKPGQGAEIPFYVGQTKNFYRRVGEYLAANFSCQPDFRVGTALKFLQDQGYEVSVKFDEARDGLARERELIAVLRPHFKLINCDLPGYDYKTADRETERKKICNFVKQIAEG